MAAPIISFTGSIPSNYEMYLGPVLFEPYALDLADRLKKEKLKEVLEIACGTGRVTNHLVKLIAPKGKLIASDLNPDMIEIAKTRVRSDLVEWKQADATDLPFQDNSFDHVVCQYGVMFFPDKLRGFTEAYRVLKPGGKYLFNTWDKLESNPRVAIISHVMREVMGDAAPDFLSEGPFSFFDRALIKQLLKQAGFRDIRIDIVKKLSHYKSEDHLVKGFIDGSPLAAYLSNMEEERRIMIRQKIKDAVCKQAVEYQNSVPLQAIVCQGTK